jgi:hypothetical protein
MALETVQEIETAIDALSPQQLQELYTWLDQHHPHLIDSRLPGDLAKGRLDTAIQRALNDEETGRIRPL